MAQAMIQAEQEAFHSPNRIGSLLEEVLMETQGVTVVFLDMTGAKNIKARISPSVTVSKIIPTIITKMSLPATSPDGMPMSYALDCKETGTRLREEQTLLDAGVKDGYHLVVFPEIVAG